MSGSLSQRFLLSGAVFLAAAAVGWMLGGTGDPVDERSGQADSRPTRSGREFRRSPHSMIPVDIDWRLAPLRAARTPEERWRATIHLARTLPVNELAAWYDGEWFGEHRGMEENLFYRITRARWLDEDPAGLVARCLLRKSDKTDEAFGEWVKRDPRGALGWFEQLERPRDQLRLLHTLGAQLAASDPLLALDQVTKLQQFASAQQGGQFLRPMIDQLAEGAGEALCQASGAWPPELRRTADRALAAASLKRDFRAGLAELRDHPQGLDLFTQAIDSSDLGGQLLEVADQLPDGWLAAAVNSGSYSLVRKDPAGWLKIDLAGLGVEGAAASRLRSMAASVLAGRDPKVVLKMLDDEGLPQEARSNLISNALPALARRDPDAARDWIARLSDPQEIEIAEAAVARATESGTSAREKPTPGDWVSTLAESEGKVNYQLLSQAGGWDRATVREARDAFAALPDERKAVAAAALTGDDPFSGGTIELKAEAFSFLVANPAAAADDRAGGERGDRLIGQVSELATQWVAEDPLAATAWVRSLPDGDERSWATKNLAAHWAEYEPSAAAAWVASLPAGERAEVEEFLETPAHGN